MRPVPRVLVQYWHDLDALPADVAECIETWKPLCAGIGLRHFLFGDASARTFISRFLGPSYGAAFDRCRHPAMRSDYFRLCWILAVGGFYVDADDCFLGADCEVLFADDSLKVQPMCYDLQIESMVSPSAFLGEEGPSANRIYYVNNNPLVSAPRHPVIQLALTRSTRLLLHAGPTRDVQGTTGPGNLTASLVRHAVGTEGAEVRDVTFLRDWDAISVSRWPLSYRDDERNWRLWSSTP